MTFIYLNKAFVSSKGEIFFQTQNKVVKPKNHKLQFQYASVRSTEFKLIEIVLKLSLMFKVWFGINLQVILPSY